MFSWSEFLRFPTVRRRKESDFAKSAIMLAIEYVGIVLRLVAS